MSCRFCLIALVVGCLAAASEGNVLYTFTYTATSGPVQSFSFSFTSPTYATDGSLPAFTPFTLTDGANSWTMTQDLVDVFDPTGLNMGCFQFGTPFASLSQGVPPFGGPCSFAVGGPGVNQGAFEFDTSGGLPSALGIYSARDFIGAFDTPAGFEYIGGPPSLVPGFDTGTMSLDITTASTPEPSSISLALLATGAAGLLSWRKRRKELRYGAC